MNSQANFYIALIHHPIVGKHGEMITTSVTNLDLHDISRSAKTFGAKGYFLVTPLKEQQGLVNRVLGHWSEGPGATLNRDRKNALHLISVVNDFQTVMEEIQEKDGKDPIPVGTSAQVKEGKLSFSDAKAMSESSGRPLLICFGTGWGIHPDLDSRMEGYFEPITGAEMDPLNPGNQLNYNHLSVRSAVAITLDRLTNGRDGPF